MKKILFIYTALSLSLALFSVHTFAAIPCIPASAAELDRRLLFNDTLAKVNTPLMNDIANRTDNIILTCKMINETVIMPGSAFSFNEVVGNRTEERGFKPAPTFIDGQVGESVGGGICQVSSTLYYACMLSNLEIVSRSSHSMSPDYVEKPGFDAAVSWRAVDYVFKNNTANPIKIFVWVEHKRVYVKIMGTKMTDNTVVIESNILSTTPFQTIHRDNPNLSPGQTKVIQIPFTGYVVETYRVITDSSGKVISRVPEAKSSYKKLDKIIERGP